MVTRLQNGQSKAAIGDAESPEATTMGRRRAIAVRMLAALGVVALNFMLVFVLSDAAGRVTTPQDLEAPGSAEAQFGADHPGEVVHLTAAVAALAIGVGGVGALVLQPRRAGAATQTLAAVAAWWLTAAVVGDPDNYGGQAGPVDVAFLVLAVPALAAALIAAPWTAWRRGGWPRPQLLIAAGLGLPWLGFAWRAAMLQRNTWPPLADPHHQAHWFMVGFVASAIVLVVAAAALAGRGWRVAAVTGGLAAIAVGVASVAAPSDASALALPWAALAVLWGVLVLVVSRRAVRSRRPPAAR